MLLAYDSADESGTGFVKVASDQSELQMSLSGLRLPSGDGCDLQREHSMSRCCVHGPTSTQWGSGSSLNCTSSFGSSEHCNSPRKDAHQNFWKDCKHLYLIAEENTDAPA